jgi:HSP20 family protein
MSAEKPSDKKQPARGERREIVPSKPKPKPRSLIASPEMSMVWKDFDRVFERFRSDFEELLWPSERLIDRAYSMLPIMKEEWPSIDLEDRSKEFVLTAEMPGLKRENVEIEVDDQSVDMKGMATWKQDEKTDKYVRKERAAQSFHRRIDLPEEIVTDNVTANMTDGILELVLPKKYPKEKRKVKIK